MTDFDGGAVTSEAGALLLRSTDQAIGLVARLAACFVRRIRLTSASHSNTLRVSERGLLRHGLGLSLRPRSDLTDEFINDDGTLKYHSNDGVLGDETLKFLLKVQLADRYGRSDGDHLSLLQKSPLKRGRCLMRSQIPLAILSEFELL